MVASGAATVPAGAREAGVALPDLAPGSYRAVGSLASSSRAEVAGSFARLPERQPVGGPANRFGVTTSAPWLVPPSRLAAFADAVREMGAGYVRSEVFWPTTEPRRGRYDTRAIDRIARVYRGRGVETLGALWSLTGNLTAPAWATTRTSTPLPADLRDAYRLGRHLAGRTDGIGGGAIELWNEPDVDVIAGDLSRTPPDRHAAYLKAAALGVAGLGRRRLLISLSGIAFPGSFDTVMLQNGVAPYADVWSFHGYAAGEEALQGNVRVDRFPPVPPVSAINAELRRLYGADQQAWMTEAGVFVRPDRPGGLSHPRQVDQARYLVRSAVEDLAAGTDKHFWFSASPYGASGYATFGLFDQSFQPWPSYSAHAAMASLLGEANFAGRLRGLPKGAGGFVFRDGGRAITVLWARSRTAVEVSVPGTRVDLHDIMGAHRATPGIVGVGSR